MSFIEPSEYHKYLFIKIKELIPLSGDNVIERKQIRNLLGKHSLPKKLHRYFLEDFESFGWIKFCTRRRYEVNKDLCFEILENDDNRNIEIL